MEMPIAVGVADLCDYVNGSRDFDTLDGLKLPMARLVPIGNPVLFPGTGFAAGQPRPLGVRLLCGRYVLRANDIDAPRIIGISEATRGDLDISSMDLNQDPGSSDLSFVWSETAQQWVFSLRTSDLGTGLFTLKVRLAGRKDYATGFELR